MNDVPNGGGAMRFRSSISVVAAVAALAAGPASAATEYTPFQTDFPTSPQVSDPFIPGVTDFPSAGPTVPQTTVGATDDAIEWGNVSIVAVLGAALGLGVAGSALMIRRRTTLAHT